MTLIRIETFKKFRYESIFFIFLSPDTSQNDFNTFFRDFSAFVNKSICKLQRSKSFVHWIRWHWCKVEKKNFRAVIKSYDTILCIVISAKFFRDIMILTKFEISCERCLFESLQFFSSKKSPSSGILYATNPLPRYSHIGFSTASTTAISDLIG